jgi:hypothetical protein
MQEEFIVCGRCGREVPKTMYCIYCGSPLSKQDKSKTRFAERKSRGEGVDLFKPEQAPDIPEPKFFRIPPYGQETRTETPRAREVDLDSDAVQLLGELSKYQKWKLKLCGLLADDRVSREVFRKIYGEYAEEIKRFNDVREEKVSALREQFDEKNSQLTDYMREHEELRVKTEVGQIPETELLIRTPELSNKIGSLTLETSRLEARLSKLENVMGDMHPKETYELEKKARRCIESLEDLVARGRIDIELRGVIREDLESTLHLFDSIHSEKRDEERELRDELETLEVRFKVGEITTSEYESLKQRALAKLEGLWT